MRSKFLRPTWKHVDSTFLTHTPQFMLQSRSPGNYKCSIYFRSWHRDCTTCSSASSGNFMWPFILTKRAAFKRCFEWNQHLKYSIWNSVTFPKRPAMVICVTLLNWLPYGIIAFTVCPSFSVTIIEITQAFNPGKPQTIHHFEIHRFNSIVSDHFS